MTYFVRNSMAGALGLVLLTGCGSSSDNSEEISQSIDRSGVQELTQDGGMQARIYPVGNVDQYEFTVSEADSLVRVDVAGDSVNSDIELSMMVSKKQEDGTFIDVFGTHKTEGSNSLQQMAIDFLNAEANTTYRVNVRDYKDDTAQPNRSNGSSEQYSISWRVSGSAINPNGTKDTATEIEPDNQASCYTGEIGTIRDVDWLTFDASNNIYQITTTWSPFNDAVTLNPLILLLNEQGVVVSQETADSNSEQSYVFTELLSTGKYSIVISDHGNDEFDPSSHYTVCVNSVASTELAVNDEQENATTYDNSGSVQGSLDYSGDVDFYNFSANAGEVINFNLNTTSENSCTVTYEVNILSSSNQSIFSNTYTSSEIENPIQIRAGITDTYSIGISESNASDCSSYSANDGSSIAYTLNLATEPLNDTNEVVEDAVCETPVAMLSSVDTESLDAKISYAGDVDCYRITINDNDTDYRMLELTFTSEATHVDYELDIRSNTDVNKTFEDIDSSDNTSSWLISYLIEPMNESEVFEIQVSDLGWDESDTDNGYTLSAKLVKIEDASYDPNPVAEGASAIVASHLYFGENDEQKALKVAAEEDVVTLDSTNQFVANDTCFSAANMNVTNDNEVTTISFSNWCSGYIDYYGDSDLFTLNLRSLYDSARGLTEASTHSFNCAFDAKLYSPAPGSIVEYAWKFHADSNVDKNISTNDYIAGMRDNSATQSGVTLQGAHTDDVNFYAAVQENISELPIYVRVLDVRLNDFDGAHDTPYYMNVSMDCQEGTSP